MNALESSTGLERLALTWLGPAVLRSVTLTLDVFSRFEAGYTKIAPVNRTRTRQLVKGQVRDKVGHDYNRHTSAATSLLSCPASATQTSSYTYYHNVASNNAFSDYSKTKDTTRRTRPFGVEYGEFESIKARLHSPPMTAHRETENRSLVYFPPCPVPQEASDLKVFYRSWSDNFLRIPSSVLLPFLESELTASKALLGPETIKLLPKIGPEARRYTLFRNLAELKDIPRAVTQLRGTFLDLVSAYRSIPLGLKEKVFSLKSLAGDIPKEYLGYHFGWKQTYKDIMDLLALPEKLAKEVNFLISRNGKPTTYRASRKFPGLRSTSPGFTDYLNDGIWFPSAPSLTTYVGRSHQVRVVVNSTFDFPTIGVPTLQRNYMLKKIGLIPTVSDLYDLVPWSWLVDWFTGLGDYVHAVDYINTDPSIINYGFATIVTDISIDTHFRVPVVNQHDIQIFGAGNSSIKNIQNLNHQSHAEIRIQARKNLASVNGDVSVTSDMSTLTLYQQSILGALIASRKPAFRT
jgi:hypothetical protein